MAHCWRIENTPCGAVRSPPCGACFPLSMWVLRWEQDTPTSIPGSGWMPLYSFWQQTQLHSHHNPMTTARWRWGVGGWGLKTVNLLHMEETIFPCKTCGSCGIPVRMMINPSVCLILLSLLFPFCPSRAEEQRADTSGGNSLLCSGIFFNMFYHWFLFSLITFHVAR